MKKKVMIMLVITALMIGGCAQAGNPDGTTITMPNENEDANATISFRTVEPTEFSEINLKALDEGKKQTGAYLFMDNGKAYLAVFAGEHPTGGYSVAVREIIQKNSALIASVELVEPGPDMMVTDALTSPMTIVELMEFESIEGLEASVEMEAITSGGEDESGTDEGSYVSPTDHIPVGETIIVGKIMEFDGDYIHIISGDLVQVFEYDQSQTEAFYLGETVELIKGETVNQLKPFLINDFSVRHTNMGQLIETVTGEVTAVDQASIKIQSEGQEIDLTRYEDADIPVGAIVEAQYVSFDGETYAVIGLYPESAKMEMIVQEVEREDDGALVLYTSEINADQVTYQVYTGNAIVELNYSEIQQGDKIVVYANEILESDPAQVYASRIVK